jgi:hypothetical protein
MLGAYRDCDETQSTATSLRFPSATVEYEEKRRLRTVPLAELTLSDLLA